MLRRPTARVRRTRRRRPLQRRGGRRRLPPPGIRARLGRLARAVAVAAGLALIAACCPVPAGAGPAPTAFDAVVTRIDATGWVAESSDGRSYRLAGPAPGAPGARVYLTGTILTDGTVRIERAEPIAAR